MKWLSLSISRIPINILKNILRNAYKSFIINRGEYILISSSLPFEKFFQSNCGDPFSCLFLATSLINELSIVNSRANFMTNIGRDSFASQVDVLRTWSHCTQKHHWMHLFIVWRQLIFDFRWLRSTWFCFSWICVRWIGCRRWWLF